MTLLFFLQDPHWDKLLRYCADNGSYEGCPLPLSEKHTVPHKYDAYNGQADVPNQYSSEVEWGDQVPQQYNNEAEWSKTGQYQYSNEPEWGEVPKQYSDDVEWDETVHEEYSNEAEWNEVPKHYSNKVEWEGKGQYPYSKEKGQYPYSNEGKWGREVGKQCSHEAERDETVPQQYSNNEAGWGKEVPNQCDSEFERGDGSSKYKSSAVESKSNPSPQMELNWLIVSACHILRWSNGMALLSNQPDGMCDT